ncbi:MAG: hypothetical protein K2V38_07970 [Gemmataceae bacterium]|nr:hypothetical protein [Gemmataceae bacterium]
MRRLLTAVGLFAAAVLAARAAADEPKKDEVRLTKKELAKLMADAHRGDKSPHARVGAELKKDAPDWEQLGKDAKAFGAMAEAFKKVELGYSSPAGYASGASALAKATADKDKKAAAEAFVSLKKACSACHYGLPPGVEK